MTFSRLSSLPHYRSSARTFSLIVLAIGLMTNASARPATAQQLSPPPNALPAETLTHSLLSLLARYWQTTPALKAQTLKNLVNTVVDRQQQLAEVIKKNPDMVLHTALLDALRVILPQEIQPYVEETVQVEGKLEVTLEHTHPGSILRYAFDTGIQRLSLHFAADPPFNLLTGAQVRVRGVRVKNALALDSGSASVQTLALSLPNTFGAQKTLVILVNFQDKATQPYTTATAENLVFNTTSNFDLENSYGQTWLTGDVVGSIVLCPITVTF